MVKIGTRDSGLALWQANKIHSLLSEIGIKATLVPVKSEGDLDLVTPLYAMGVQGVFTKTLDAYLLSKRIDIAVHSMKDVPTQLAQGIAKAAVLPRADVHDIFIPNANRNREEAYINASKETAFHIATGSIRRKAQWLHHFPNTQFENLRGNVQTRMRKLKESDWDGIIMAKAGLERVNLLPEHYEKISWMLPAPAQGAILVVCREEDKELQLKLKSLNDKEAALCTRIERDFLRTLLGGCSTPISAHAFLENNKIKFQGSVLSPDGKEKMSIEDDRLTSEAETIGIDAALRLLDKGAGKILDLIRNR